MTYRPRFRQQLDGTACQSTNCCCTSHAMASQRARRGDDPNNQYGWPPLPKPIRNKIQDQSGGGCSTTNFPENERAVATLYRVDMLPRYNIPFSSFRSMIQSGRGAVVAIKYSVISPTRFDACPGFGGGHSVYVNERRPSDGAFLVYDPLADHRRAGIPQGPQWWPATLLKRAAEAYGGTNPGCIHASFTRDTEG